MAREILKIGLAVLKGGRLLLVRKRGTACYILPGGKPEQGEDDLTALGREIEEELGCRVDLTCVRFVGDFRDRAAGHTDVDVVVKLYAGPLIGEPTPQSEIEQLLWFSPRSRKKAELAQSLSNSIVPHLIQSGEIVSRSARAHA
jgi:8-oxo-dGTP diphosphatase